MEITLKNLNNKRLKIYLAAQGMRVLFVCASLTVGAASHAGELILEDDRATTAQGAPNLKSIEAMRAAAGVASATAATDVPAGEKIMRWDILPTDTRLAVTLERWAKTAGKRLLWDAQSHVIHSSSDSFEGTLSQALERVLSSPAIANSNYPLEVCEYPNQPPVLRVTRKGEQKECK